MDKQIFVCKIIVEFLLYSFYKIKNKYETVIFTLKLIKKTNRVIQHY